MRPHLSNSWQLHPPLDDKRHLQETPHHQTVSQCTRTAQQSKHQRAAPPPPCEGTTPCMLLADASAPASIPHACDTSEHSPTASASPKRSQALLRTRQYRPAAPTSATNSGRCSPSTRTCDCRRWLVLWCTEIAKHADTQYDNSKTDAVGSMCPG